MIRCRSCGQGLSGELIPVEAGFESLWEETEQAVPAGRMWTTTAGSAAQLKLIVMVNNADGRALVRDFSGAGGCCGNSSHVTTHYCGKCLAPVGTEINDCWTGLYLYFEPDAVTYGDPSAAERALWRPPRKPVQTAMATLYVRHMFAIATTHSRTSAGVWFEHRTVHRNHASGQTHLTSAIATGLDWSSLDAGPVDPDELRADLLAAANVSTMAAFMRGTIAIHALRTIETITLLPTHNSGPVAGFAPKPHNGVRIEMDLDNFDATALVPALEQALKACS